MDYIEINFTVSPKEPGNEILTAVLADIGFESFVETDTGLLAYIPNSKFSIDIIEKLDIMQDKEFSISYNCLNIKDKNWNEEWESSFAPVVISDKCYVRAPFHPENKSFKYEIIIEPKMSFGTAHHETTALMIEQILSLNIKNKSVLDMGCGTAILAILAVKMGASEVTAIDIDEWAFNNSIENIEKNNAKNIKIILGDVEMAVGKYDFIFANINRNILVNDISEYSKRLNKSGILLMSGFYEADIPIINDVSESNDMNFVDSSLKNKWAVLKYKNK